MRKTKLQLALSSILLVTMVLLFVATTVAYFSDNKRFTNTITSGNVEILLSESAVKRDAIGNLVQDPTANRIYGTTGNEVHNYGKIYPSQTIYKDPTIQNIGSEEAWVAFKITIKDGNCDIRNVLGYENSNLINIRELFSGGLFDQTVALGKWNNFDGVVYNDNYAMVQVPEPGKNQYEFYVFVLDPLEQNKTVTVFNTMTISSDWSNTDMKEFAELTIEIEAFGVQTFNMSDCYTAMTTALPEHFNFN